jgi:hypothetical protein
MENITKKYSNEDASTYAYTVLSHLVSHRNMSFVEMRDLLGISHNGNWYANLLAYIVKGIKNLKEKWNESIPPITALVFDNHGRSSTWVCGCLTGDRNKQPTPQQIEEVRESVAVYDKWDKVLEYFRP